MELSKKKENERKTFTFSCQKKRKTCESRANLHRNLRSLSKISMNKLNFEKKNIPHHFLVSFNLTRKKKSFKAFPSHSSTFCRPSSPANSLKNVLHSLEFPPVNIHQETVHHFHFPAGGEFEMIPFESIFHPSPLRRFTWCTFSFHEWKKKRISLVEPFSFSISAKLEGFFRHHHSSFVLLFIHIHAHCRKGFIFLVFFTKIQFHFTWK